MEYISAKTIVTRTKAPAQWFGIDYNMNMVVYIVPVLTYTKEEDR